MYGHLISAICLLIPSLAIIGGCGFLVKNPDVSVKNVALISLSLRDLSLRITLAVDNPNPAGITLKTLAFDIFYQKGNDWVFLSHGEQNGVAIKSGRNEVTIPVKIINAELLSALLGMITSGKVTLQVKGAAAPDLFLLVPKIPFSHTMTIPLERSGS